jgi:beta-N-acetylhexosaminidase
MRLRPLPALVLVALLVFSLFPAKSVRASGDSQDVSAAVDAQQMLSRMTPEERVGQLFLVSFTGSTVNETSQIYDLITRYHIGGAVLRAKNDNFVAAPDTVATAYQLISQLQQAENQSSPTEPVSTVEAGTPTPLPAPTAVPGNFIPLFIGISQDGDGYPNDQILSGLTPLPDLMALGATWAPVLAEKVGSVAGQELSSIGFNLYLGPSLDVLESPEATLLNGLDANVFGGDPYWVGVMGSAYISGLHSGSNQRMAVVTDHFPGRGSADRPVGEEPATVRKSLEQLKQIELAPFFAVTGNAQNPQSAVDGLLVSHIRYQGFQGNIRSTTRPVSFDPQALLQILSLPAFSSWRAAGGLMISDDLGSQTVRLFYDPGGKSFQARLVALDAFLAGNDLLYMGNIISSDAADNYASVVQSLEFFIQKYRGDTAFAKRVDDAVLRILTKKFELYGEFDPQTITPAESGLEQLGKSESITFEVARQSATLVSPDKLELETVLPSPPVVEDRIVFLTDSRPGKQCSSCAEEPMFAVDALQNAILRLYGFQAGGKVIAGRLISFSLESTSGILAGGLGNQELEDALNGSDWVVINMLNAEPGETQTTLLRRFLSERQDLLRNKHVVVFAYNAPYFLDATDISKVTTYYCLYGKSAPFVEVAARLLFRELSPDGTLPVSVAGIGYDLLSATAPDPSQLIQLSLEFPASPTPVANDQATPEPSPTPSFLVGDTLTARTGVIVDHNGHPVPDGTGVQFRIAMTGADAVVQQTNSTTVQGVARAAFNIDRPGLLEISATSDPAITSVVLQLTVTSEGSSVIVVTPTPVPEFTPTPTVEITPTPTPVPTPPPPEPKKPGIVGWLEMVFIVFAAGFLVYWLGSKFAGARWGIRLAMCVALGGLLAYTSLAVHLPGTETYFQKGGLTGMAGVVLLGIVAGVGTAYIWYRLTRGPGKPPD